MRANCLSTEGASFRGALAYKRLAKNRNLDVSQDDDEFHPRKYRNLDVSQDDDEFRLRKYRNLDVSQDDDEFHPRKYRNLDVSQDDDEFKFSQIPLSIYSFSIIFPSISFRVLASSSLIFTDLHIFS